MCNVLKCKDSEEEIEQTNENDRPTKQKSYKTEDAGMMSNHINNISQCKNCNADYVTKEKLDEIMKQHNATRPEVLEHRLEGEVGI